MIEGQGVRFGDRNFFDLPAQIHREENMEKFNTNCVFCFAGIRLGVVSHALANPITVVLAPCVLIPYRCNQCIDQLHGASTGHMKKPQLRQSRNANLDSLPFATTIASSPLLEL